MREYQTVSVSETQSSDVFAGYEPARSIQSRKVHNPNLLVITPINVDDDSFMNLHRHRGFTILQPHSRKYESYSTLSGKMEEPVNNELDITIG